MTLNTKIYVLDPGDYREVFTKCNQLIGSHEGVEWTDSGSSIWNHLGQGLCAALDVDYTGIPEGGHADYCEPDDPEESHTRCFPYSLRVSFDTTYSYEDEYGGCGDLHARLVATLGAWLDGKGARWLWENEFTGEIHEGYDRLGDLGDGGEAAAEWMASTVLPAIAARLED
jgi:hypothetical protein